MTSGSVRPSGFPYHNEKASQKKLRISILTKIESRCLFNEQGNDDVTFSDNGKKDRRVEEAKHVPRWMSLEDLAKAID